MQIKELTLPPNQKKITYEINNKGETLIYISPTKNQKKLLQVCDQSKIHLSQLNSIQMTQANLLQNILQKNPFETDKKGKVKKQIQEKKRQICCTCKKSKCLKMYCECFANKLFCTSQCGCKNCTNTQVNAQKLLYIRQQLDLKKHSQQKGCKCTKSGCNKKYCYCFSNNKKCGQSCICTNCQNIDLEFVQKIVKE